jgi:hypothetical protein
MSANSILKLSVDAPAFAANIRERCLSHNKELSAGTLKNYPSQLKSLLKKLGVKNIGEALKKTAEEYKEALKDIPLSTRSTLINSIVATLKACDIKTDLKFDEIKKMNNEIGHEKMEPMKENAGDIPADFDKKVKDYLAAHKGSLNSVIIALMALSPTVRGHMLEGVVIARGEEEYARIKEENKSPVIGEIGNTYKFTYVAGNRASKASAKVKGIREETVYSDAVAQQLKAFIKPNQTYMFAPRRGKGEYVTTKTFNDWIAEAFAAAGIPEMGVQKLRRIYETRISSNPTMSFAQKEQVSRQMNHSRLMGEKYVVVPKGDTPAAQKVIDDIGTIVSEIMVKMVSIKDLDNLKLVRTFLSSQSEDIDAILKYERIGTRIAPSPPGVPMRKTKDSNALNF